MIPAAVDERPTPTAWWRNAISRFDSTETFVRRTLRQRLQSLRLFQRYKTQRQILMLQEVVELLAQQPVHCYVVGGFAYDGMRRELLSIHDDIDLAVLHSDAEAVHALFRERGFTVKRRSPYNSSLRRDGHYIDMFHWKDAGGGKLQYMASDTVLRIPKAFLTTVQHAALMGVNFSVPSNEYMVSTLPVIQKPAHRAFVQTLSTEAPVSCTPRQEVIQVSVKATVHEFGG